MAISMMAGRATAGYGILGTRDPFAITPTTDGSSSRLNSSSSEQFARQLGCLKRRVDFRYVQQSIVRYEGKSFPAFCRLPGTQEYRSFGQRSDYHPSSRSMGRGRRLGNDNFVSSAAAPNTLDVTDDGAQQSDYGRLLFNFLQRVATVRILPILVFGLGVVLSLRAGPAGAAVASEAAISPSNKGLLASAWAGLVAGCLHTLTGPDHLAALAPLCIGRSRLQSAAVGALWGFGHDTGQIIFGLIFLVLKDKLHIELIRTWASRVVGLTLITIGGVGIYECQVPVTVLAEEAGLQDGGGGHQEVRIKNDSKNATTFATGVVYGLQPDALLMILPALALPSRITGAAFLAMFLLGTVLAMGSYTLFLSSCSHALQKRIPGITKNLTLGSSVIAIALGFGLVVSELFGLSLF